MRTASLRKLTVGAISSGLAAGLVLTGCGTTAEGGSASDSGGDDGPITGLRFMVPNSPGSGYDTTAREVARVMEEEEIATGIEVFNLEGAGGTVGLQRLVNEEGNADMLMQMGLGVVGAQFSNQSEATLDQTTPIAKLIEEAEAIVVPGDSPYQNLDDLVTAWKADPGNVPVGGASNPGGPDHLTPMLLAEEVGLDPAEVNYVAYDGGGELLAGILGGDVQFSPTLTEEGIDLVFANWRGIVAPPGISDDDTQKWIDAITEMHDSDAWTTTLEDQGWTDSFMTGDEFSSYLGDESERVESVMSGLGLA
jgi:putative tricarboxylic transport membrane protein